VAERFQWLALHLDLNDYMMPSWKYLAVVACHVIMACCTFSGGIEHHTGLEFLYFQPTVKFRMEVAQDLKDSESVTNGRWGAAVRQKCVVITSGPAGIHIHFEISTSHYHTKRRQVELCGGYSSTQCRLSLIRCMCSDLHLGPEAVCCFVYRTQVASYLRFCYSCLDDCGSHSVVQE
jgi:hypothetical protein